MKLIRKRIKPTSPGVRSLVRFDRSIIYKGRAYKRLTRPRINSGEGIIMDIRQSAIAGEVST
ncbi:MAG: hypothetical protein ACTS6G_04810, partial [Candidatus Hodgkinia cicadicola]